MKPPLGHTLALAFLVLGLGVPLTAVSAPVQPEPPAAPSARPAPSQEAAAAAEIADLKIKNQALTALVAVIQQQRNDLADADARRFQCAAVPASCQPGK